MASVHNIQLINVSLIRNIYKTADKQLFLCMHVFVPFSKRFTHLVEQTTLVSQSQDPLSQNHNNTKNHCMKINNKIKKAFVLGVFSNS